jgi:hypothetical protein
MYNGVRNSFNVTACYCCKLGRGQWRLEESELIDPRGLEPVVDMSDGLIRLDKVKLESFQFD